MKAVWEYRPGLIWRMSAALAAGIILAAGMYFLYIRLFPFRGSPAGVCMHCGAHTRFEPSGWAAFCPRHDALIPVIPPLLIIGETLSLALAAVALWCIIRTMVHRGGPPAAKAVMAVWICATVLGAWVCHAAMPPVTLFLLCAGALLFALTALYTETIESLFMMLALACGLAAGLALLIKLVAWITMGYLQLV
ncbi:MAG: hypothetical protein NT045_01260 [Candidatus Aureabacteria bacterium]|nr:hypothetical protein [Candidatus Auribacterota bacterium]